MCVSARVGQKRASDPLELGVQVVVSHLSWVTGSKLVLRKCSKHFPELCLLFLNFLFK